MGFVAFLLFLFLAVQVLFGLYATSTLRATVHDATARAAAGRGAAPAGLESLAADAERSLGEVGQRPSTVVELELVDEDGDGSADVAVGRGRMVPPRFVPPTIGGVLGFDEVTAGARVRVERLR
ncbi:MAG TPA: hypothetical protein VFW63_04820 [Acidimicrobiales bacterium]|nr:hypothetical protein [Acidimicrobiales bacterium]